tara:strand:+ start:3885 stop:5747 length:1863 start_codon:yes stop_codon:yes gene_type:complete
MNSNAILEIKQSEGIKIQSGEFTNNLSKPITIYDQDQISINKVFIDTEAQTDAIIDIPFDIQLNTTHALSIVNDNVAKFASYSDGSNTVDNVEYFLYDVTTAGHVNESNMMHMTKMTIRAIGIGTTIGDPDGTNPIEFEYTDLLDNKRRVYISFPKQTVNPNSGNEFTVDLFVQKQGTKAASLSQGAQIQIVQHKDNLERVAKCNMYPQIDNDGTSDNARYEIEFSTPADGTFTEDNLTPHLFKQQMVILEGKYQAQDICDLITNNFSQNNHSNQFTINDNVLSQFLVNSSQYNTPTANLAVSNFNNSGLGSSGLGLSDMRTGVLNDNFFVGSNQVQLSFNTITNKFFWNFLHFPVYNRSGTICTRIIGTENPNFTHQTKNGSIAFLELSARNNKTQEPFDFWGAKLGFQMNRICVTPAKTLTFDDDGSIYHAELISVDNGLNTTSAKVDLDSIVQKADPTGGDAEYNYQKVQSHAPFEFIENSFNQVVEATRSVVSVVADITIPYFLIEMNAGFHNELISTERTSSTIQAIVDRYYSKGSYTMGSPNSITYTHRGQPIVLSKFYTRILQPDRTVPQQIGDDNTLFIEIIRNNEFYLMKKQLEIQQEIEEELNSSQKNPN